MAVSSKISSRKISYIQSFPESHLDSTNKLIEFEYYLNENKDTLFMNRLFDSKKEVDVILVRMLEN